MRGLAEQASVSVGTIYNLIGGQNDVLAAIATEMIDTMLDAISAVAGDNPLERLEKMAMAPVTLLIANPKLHKPALRILERTPGYDSHALYESTCIDVIERDLARAICSGYIEKIISPARLSQHIFQNAARAMSDWASSTIDDNEFWLRVMDGVYLTLAAVSSEPARSVLRKKLRASHLSMPQVTTS